MEPLERKALQRSVERLADINSKVSADEEPKEKGGYKVIATPLMPADQNDPQVIATRKKFEEHMKREEMKRKQKSTKEN